MVNLNTVSCEALDLAIKRGKKLNNVDNSLSAFKQEVYEVLNASETKSSEHLNTYSEVTEELIDVLISCLTELRVREVDIEKLLNDKMQFNRSRAGLQSKPIQPHIITLVGSSLFSQDFIRVAKELSVKGNIVLSKEIFHHCQSVEGFDPDAYLELHLRKIDISDEVFVINKDGYIGEGTRTCIKYALSLGKQITFMEETKG